MQGWYVLLPFAITLQSTELEQSHRLQHKNTFVLKTYRAAEAEQNYKAESEAYMKLRWGGKPTPHIITYYGGFVHGNSYNIILEYADRGTLENFMRKTDPPSTFRDTLMFWKNFVNVTHGIMTIHGQIGNESSASQLLNGYVLCLSQNVSLLTLYHQVTSRHQTS